MVSRVIFWLLQSPGAVGGAGAGADAQQTREARDALDALDVRYSLAALADDYTKRKHVVRVTTAAGAELLLQVLLFLYSYNSFHVTQLNDLISSTSNRL